MTETLAGRPGDRRTEVTDPGLHARISAVVGQVLAVRSFTEGDIISVAYRPESGERFGWSFYRIEAQPGWASPIWQVNYIRIAGEADEVMSSLFAERDGAAVIFISGPVPEPGDMAAMIAGAEKFTACLVGGEAGS